MQRHMVQLILWISEFVQTTRYALELGMRRGLWELMLGVVFVPNHEYQQNEIYLQLGIPFSSDLV